MELAQTLHQAIVSLRNGETEAAIAALEQVLANEAFSQSEELLDIRARTHSLYGQALLDQNRFTDARASAETAMELAKRMKDTIGQQQIRKLLQDISARQLEALKMAGHLRKQQSSPEKTLDSLIQDAQDASSLDEIITQAANKLRIGRYSEAQELAQHVLNSQSASEKDRVIAHLLWIHTDPDSCILHLEKAWAIADEANDFNLLQAIAKTASEFNHPIAVLNGPKMDT